MGKLAVLATQSHGVLTCECDCVAKNACLPLPAEIKPPQTTQNCHDDGKSSAAISRTNLTLRVRYFPRQPRMPVLPRRPPDSQSTSYPAGRTRWHLQTPVCHHRVTTKKVPTPFFYSMLTPYPPSFLVLSTPTTGRSMIASRARRRSCSRGWWWTLRQRRWRRRPWTHRSALWGERWQFNK